MGKIALWWVFSVALVGAVASVVTAQALRQSPVAPRVVSGSDFGFRVEGTDSRGRPTGTFVIRMNGEWVEVVSVPKATPASTR